MQLYNKIQRSVFITGELLIYSRHFCFSGSMTVIPVKLFCHASCSFGLNQCNFIIKIYRLYLNAIESEIINLKIQRWAYEKDRDYMIFMLNVTESTLTVCKFGTARVSAPLGREHVRVSGRRRAHGAPRDTVPLLAPRLHRQALSVPPRPGLQHLPVRDHFLLFLHFLIKRLGDKRGKFFHHCTQEEEEEKNTLFPLDPQQSTI